MKTMKRVIYAMVFVLIAIALFAIWYKATYSMGIAASYELNDPGLEKRLLIVTQESPFKKALTEDIVNRIKGEPVYIRVIDVTELNGVDPTTWTAMVVMHTWEIGEPEEHAAAFVTRAPRRNTIVITTSGGGDQMIAGVDGITAASKMEDVSRLAATVVDRINALINN